jgi:hypothetical protein
MAKSHKVTTEEKFVARLTDMLSDLRLDLDMVGLYFGRYASRLTYMRLETIFLSAQHHRESANDRGAHYDNIKHI